MAGKKFRLARRLRGIQNIPFPPFRYSRSGLDLKIGSPLGGYKMDAEGAPGQRGRMRVRAISVGQRTDHGGTEYIRMYSTRIPPTRNGEPIARRVW